MKWVRREWLMKYVHDVNSYKHTERDRKTTTNNKPEEEQTGEKSGTLEGSVNGKYV